MKLKHKKYLRKGFSLVELLVVIAIIAGLAAMSYGPIMKQVKQGKQAQAISQGKNLSVALQSFAKDNDGLYPGENTARKGQTGNSAEACFTQLLSGGYVDEEKTFWNTENAILGMSSLAPDEDGVLTEGENVWGYVAGLNSSSRTSLPLFFDASVGPGKFSTEVWDGRSILAKMDTSVKATEISVAGEGSLNDDGSYKVGSITATRGKKEYDIFGKGVLPRNAEVFAPSGNLADSSGQ